MNDLFASLPDKGGDPFSSLPDKNPFDALPEKSSGFTRTVVGGVRDFAQNLKEGTESLARTMESVIPLGSISTEGYTREFETLPDFPEVEQPHSIPGRMARGVIQFSAGFLPIFRATNALAAPTSYVGKLAAGEVAALMAGQAGMDPYEDRLSNLVEQFPSLSNPVTRFLEAHPEDSESEVRLKMALEDLGIGAVFTGFIESLKALRFARKMKAKPEEVIETVAKSTKEPKGSSIIDTTSNISQAKRAVKVPTPDEMNLNLNRLDTDESVKKILVENSTANDHFMKSRRGVQSHAETQRLADSMGMSKEQLLKMRNGSILNAEEALAARQKMVQSAEQLVGLAKKAQGGSDDAVIEFRKAMLEHTALQERVAGITAEAGRLLNQFNILAKSEGSRRVQMIKELIASSGGREKIEEAARLIADLETPSQISRAAREMAKPKFIHKVQEVWINSLLSGPQTHAVNMTSNSLVSLWSIPEHFLASGFRAARTKNPQAMKEVGARLYGMVEGAKDGLRLASKAFITGEPSDILSKIEVPHPTAIKGKVGDIIRLPVRFLQAEDEFFKTIGYRMELRQLAMRSGLDKNLKGRELAEHIESVLRNPPASLEAAAIDAARYQTFTKPVGTIAGAAQTVIAKHPILKFLAPFIRTPTNIIKYAGERSPFGLAMSEVKEALKQGGAARDIALARMSLGTAVSAGVVSLALDDTITGSGPVDPDQRAILRASGWAPFSVKVGDTYYSYQRLEPLGMLFGVAADYANIVRYLGEDDPEVIKLAKMIQAGVANNLTSKTWLRGISDAMQAFSDPERYGESWISSFVGTTVPTGVAHIARTQDPVLRQARGLADTLKKRIPGMSDDLPAARNLFGEKIVLEGGLGPDIVSPIYTTSIKENPVAKEMVRLDMALSRPSRKIDGVELPSELYAQYVEMAGKPATAALKAIIATPQWQSMPDFKKQDMIRDTFLNFRRAARMTIIAQNPDLQRQIGEEKLKQYGVK